MFIDFRTFQYFCKLFYIQKISTFIFKFIENLVDCVAVVPTIIGYYVIINLGWIDIQVKYCV